MRLSNFVIYAILLPWCAVPFVHASFQIRTISYKQLLSDEATFLNGTQAYIVNGATSGWGARYHWTPQYLVNKTSSLDGTNIVDWYPDNMVEAGVHPYLTQLPAAFTGLLEKKAKLEDTFRKRSIVSWHHSAYAQWRLPLAQQKLLWDDLQPFPAFLNPHWWLNDCLPDDEVRNNAVMVIAWFMLVIGPEGAGMFAHQDNFDSGTWQAQIIGSKDWVICNPALVPHGETLYKPGQVDFFDVDRQAFPHFSHSSCTRITAQPGQILMYPSHWWHQTRVGKQPKQPGHPNDGLSYGLAGRWVNRANYMDIADAIQRKCDNPGVDASKKFKGAAPAPLPALCEALPKCRSLWARHFAKNE
jgi:hypothetical protein